MSKNFNDSFAVLNDGSKYSAGYNNNTNRNVMIRMKYKRSTDCIKIKVDQFDENGRFKTRVMSQIHLWLLSLICT